MSFIDWYKNLIHIKMIYATLKYGVFWWISMASKKLVSCPNLSFIEWIDFLKKIKTSATIRCKKQSGMYNF